MGVWSGERQIGHNAEEGAGGIVRIWRRVVEEMGGLVRGEGFVVVVCGEGAVFDCLLGGDDALEVGCDEGRSPEIGGGRSRFSVAFLESCRAKSEACHHSRNLSAKMEVGRRTLRDERRRGKIAVAKVRGLNIVVVCGGTAVASAPAPAA